jgi:adenylate cyclase
MRESPGRDRAEKKPQLTRRQAEILELMGKGLTNREICSVLAISPNTVKSHVASILRTLEATNRTEAAVLHEQARAETSDAPHVLERPAVAVLPFEVPGGDAGQGYFVDGLVDELITRLAVWRLVPVIARSSTFAFRGRGLDVRAIGAALGARYVVEGSMRRSGSRIRALAQLSEAESARVIWAEDYDLELAEVFAAQDDLARRIVASLQREIRQHEQHRASIYHAHKLDVWDRTWRGMWHARRRSSADSLHALACFSDSLGCDRDFVPALAAKARLHYVRICEQWSDDYDADLEQMRASAEHALLVDSGDASSQLAVGISRMQEGASDDALEHLSTAAKLNPSEPDALALLGQVRAMRGDPETGVAHLRDAMRLSPFDPQMWSYTAAMALCYFACDDLGSAIEWARRSLRMRPDFGLARAALTASLALSGSLDSARASLADLRRVQPMFSRAHLDLVTRSTDKRYVQRLFDGLQRAGA